MLLESRCVTPFGFLVVGNPDGACLAKPGNYFLVIHVPAAKGRLNRLYL